MDSKEWKKRMDDTNADIAAKELRRAAIASEKTLVLTDSKKLTALEAEEITLPALIEQLTRRVPLLSREHEAALKVEAAERLQEIVTLAETAAHQVSESTVRLREGMRALLALLAADRRAAEGHAVLVAEARFLEVRFALPALHSPVGDRLSGNERGRFLRECGSALQQNVTKTSWDWQRSEFLEMHRRKDAAHREGGHPPSPTRVHYSDDATAETDALHQEARRRMSDAARAGEKQVIHWSDGVRSQ